jgi:anhydro-N-acetylmuramic acid kinase
MIYKVIGVSIGQALTGLDIVFVAFAEIGGKWSYELIAEQAIPLNDYWKEHLEEASKLSVLEYQLLHTAFGRFIGEQVNHFIHHHSLAHTVQLIASQGYTLFHLPERKISAQLGHGAFIAAVTKLPVVSDLCSLDMAFGGRGEPLNAITSKLLQSENLSLPLTVALLGVLRWREETTLLGSSSGAERDSIGGALWLGTEA